MASCTFIESSSTEVDCPCVITEISQSQGRYSVTATSIQNPSEYFTFWTTTYHQIGDKIN